MPTTKAEAYHVSTVARAKSGLKRCNFNIISNRKFVSTVARAKSGLKRARSDTRTGFRAVSTVARAKSGLKQRLGIDTTNEFIASQPLPALSRD